MFQKNLYRNWVLSRNLKLWCDLGLKAPWDLCFHQTSKLASVFSSESTRNVLSKLLMSLGIGCICCWWLVWACFLKVVGLGFSSSTLLIISRFSNFLGSCMIHCKMQDW